MVDLPFSGPRFTWVRGSLSKRLDRVLSNKDWILKFDNYSVTNLPRVDSDHRPVLVRFERNGRRNGEYKAFPVSSCLDDKQSVWEVYAR